MRSSATLLLFAYATLSDILPAQATFTGYVREDSTLRGLSGAEIVVHGTGLSVRTDGNGRFALRGLTPGTHGITARLVGFEPAYITLSFDAGASLNHVFYLTRSVVRLDTVTTTAKERAPLGIGREGLAHRRSLGFGKFVDDTTLKRAEHRRLSDVLREIPGVNIWIPRPPNRNARIVVSGRLTGSTCAMQIWIDGAMVFRGGTDNISFERADIDQYRVAQIEAVEVYRSASEMPPGFGGGSAACGVIMMWSRRGHGDT